jgi:hypothetical protein
MAGLLALTAARRPAIMSLSLPLGIRRLAGAPCESHGDGRLEAARQDFVDALADVGRDAARRMQLKARLAMSIPELWHLRPGVFELVAQCHSEREAWQRLECLNRHFPTRSPRSGFGGLDPMA